MEWRLLHGDELAANWEAAVNRPPLTKIEPLEWSMFAHVVKAEHMEDCKVRLAFHDGLDGMADLSAVHGEAFRPLRGLKRFRSLALAGRKPAWRNGAGIAPEFLHRRVVGDGG